MSLCVADLNHDQQPELIYSNSYGSGIVRSMIGAYVEHNGQPQFIRWEGAHPDDLFLNKVNPSTVLVEVRPYLNGFWSWEREERWGPLQATLGTLALQGEEEDLTLIVQFNESLSKEQRDKIW